MAAPMLTVVLAASAIFVTFIGCRLIRVLGQIRKNRRTASPSALKRKNVNTMIILGSGGHTAEMITLVRELSTSYYPRLYVVANTDRMSKDKAQTLEQKKFSKKPSNEEVYRIVEIPRSREVKQSWISTVFSTLYSTLYSFPLVLKARPNLILCNGPGTCIPLCYSALMLRVLGWTDTQIVYVESICRVQTFSLSAKLLYYVADHMIVQWPQLKEKYPLTQYLGRVV